MSPADIREQPGMETASERFRRLQSDGKSDWSAWCTSSDYCTTPCMDCAQDDYTSKSASGLNTDEAYDTIEKVRQADRRDMVDGILKEGTPT